MQIFTYIEINIWNILAYPYALIFKITNKILTLTDFVCTVLKMLKQKFSCHESVIHFLFILHVPFCNPYTDMIYKLSHINRLLIEIDIAKDKLHATKLGKVWRNTSLFLCGSSFNGRMLASRCSCANYIIVFFFINPMLLEQHWC